jgi:hypothetical protein
MLISIYLLFVSLNTSALENNNDLNVGIKKEKKANILSMQTIEAVLNDDKRTKPDYLKDEHRKPTEILTFLMLTLKLLFLMY